MVKYKINFNIGDIVQSLLKAGIIVILFVIVGHFTFFDNLREDVPIYDHQNVTGDYTIDSGEQVQAHFQSFTPFKQVSVMVPQNQDAAALHISLLSSEGKVMFDTSESDCIYEQIESSISGYNQAVITSTGNDFLSGEYTLVIENTGEQGIFLATEDTSIYGGIDSDERYGKLNIGVFKESRFLGYMLWFCIFTIFLYLFMVFYLNSSDNLNVYSFFIVSGIMLGLILYLVLFPAWSTNDSAVHFLAIYRYSNVVFGVNPYDVDASWEGRASDVMFYDNIWESRRNGRWPSVESYYRVIRGDVYEPDGEMMQMTRAEHMMYYSPFNYLPFIAGISIGRLLKLGTVPCVYLGRILAGILYLLLTYNAIRKIPFAKSIIAMIALLPISLMQLTCLGYDGIAFVVALNVIALSLKSQYGDGDLQRSEIIQGIIWAFLLGAVKGGGYLIFLPMFCLFIKRSNHRSNISAAAFLLTAVVSVWCFDKLLQIPDLEFFQLKGGEDRLSTSYALEHPYLYLRLWLNTMVTNLDNYGFTALGKNLGWNESVVPSVPLACILFLVIICGLTEEVQLSRGCKIAMWIVVAISLVCTPAMLLKETDVDATTISGVQGRYFLPILPLLVTLLTYSNFAAALTSDSSTELQQKVTRKCYMIFAVVSCVIVMYLLRTYMTR